MLAKRDTSKVLPCLVAGLSIGQSLDSKGTPPWAAVSAGRVAVSESPSVFAKKLPKLLRGSPFIRRHFVCPWVCTVVASESRGYRVRRAKIADMLFPCWSERIASAMSNRLSFQCPHVSIGREQHFAADCCR